MKTFLLSLAASAVLLLSCNQTDIKSPKNAIHEHHLIAQGDQNSAREAGVPQKWKTDESTRTHVAELRTKLEAFKRMKEHNSSSYKALGADMSGELKKLVAGCRMTGPAHDALHGWLTPVLEKVSQLNKSKSVAQGQMAVDRIEDSLDNFYKEFE